MLAAIVNHLWQSTAFAVGVGLLTLAFRRDGAHVRYWLWWAASIKFLVPFSWLAALGRGVAPSVGVLELPAQWSAAAGRVAQPVAASGSVTPLGLALLAIWAAGLLGVLGYRLAGARRVRALLVDADPAAHTLSDGGREIRVYHSRALVEPCMVGIFSPLLVLPRGLASHLSQPQLEAVIAHELCHARRQDNLTAAAHMLVEAVFWFHPLVWWIGARLLHERERACDEAVVRAGHDRSAYAEGVLNTCELYATSPLACAAGVGGADLKRRITRIMRGDTMSKLGMGKKLFLGTLAAAMLAAPVMIGFLAQSTARAQQDDAWLPIVKVAPVYPVRALERGLEGYVVLEYTVTERGAVEDAIVVESSSTLFHEAALDSVRKYKYSPRIENGEPVAVPGVQSIIRFELEQEDI